MKAYRVDAVTHLENGLVLIRYNDGTTMQLSGMESFNECVNPDSLSGMLENVAKNIAACLFNKAGKPVTLIVDMQLESQIIMETDVNG